MLARAARIVVTRLERDHAAGALRQSVEAEQRAAEGAKRGLEHRRRDRCRAIGDRAQRRVVALTGAGDGGQHLQHRRDQHRVRDAQSLEGVEDALGVELAHEHRGGSVPEAAVRPADPPDVEHGQRGEAHGALVESPSQGGLRSHREVGVRGEDALGHSGGAGRVHLDDHVVGFAAGARIARLVRRQPALVALPHDDQVRRRRQPLRTSSATFGTPGPRSAAAPARRPAPRRAPARPAAS